jgi:multiple sugar transport system permease protein
MRWRDEAPREMRRATPRERVGSALIYLALAAAIFLALFPFWWMIDTSLKRPIDIFSGTALWPQHLTFHNYGRLIHEYHFDSFLMNSLVVVTASVGVSLVIGTLAAYGLARFRMRFGVDRIALYGVLLVRMLPGILLVVPLYIVLAKWGLLNTRLGLILIYAGLNTSYVVWMMQSFLEDIPRDIEEAAMVDGDSRLTALRRVVIPLAAPGLIATAIFAVIATYNDFIIALTLTSTPDAQTVPVGVSTLIGKIQIEWGPMAAAGVIGALPIVLFALVVQRHFVRGLTMGAVK